MSNQVTIGGDRLGSGNKNKVTLDGFSRSTHDIGYVWRSSMSAGTIVPFIGELALPGDSFEIDLNANVLTLPTLGPLFGSYKVQLDVFSVPIRAYQAMLQMDMINIGMKMNEVTFPQILVEATNRFDTTRPLDNQQINPSSLMAYLGIRGVGFQPTGQFASRLFNGIKYLAYFDVFKQYYANKQEENAYIIHNNLRFTPPVIESMIWYGTTAALGGYALQPYTATGIQYLATAIRSTSHIEINMGQEWEEQMADQIYIGISQDGSQFIKLTEAFDNITYDPAQERVTATGWLKTPGLSAYIGAYEIIENTGINPDQAPRLVEFPLENIDKARMDILQAGRQNVTISGRDDIGGIPGTIIDYPPYVLPLTRIGTTPENTKYSINSNQEGLLVKTYQSDLFNNWVNTEFITGDNGINEITAVQITDGTFTIDELNLSKKLYRMLNKIAISGGSASDWQNAVYDVEGLRGNNPIYCGGLSKELTFQTVVSNTSTEDQPLGTLGGRGTMSEKHKGGHVKIKVSEASYIVAYVSITPRIDYSQGNKWDNNLKNMDELHKPDLDQIGYQDLLTDQMAWWDSQSVYQENPYEQQWAMKSAGKQPAWINYMTNVNQVLGNFADQNQEMFMTLNRRYEADFAGTDSGQRIPTVKDLTTYIDPTKYNYIFADTRLDAQNFWTQIAVNMTARRIMSAKQIPNL